MLELKTETAPNPSLLRPTPLYFFISPLGPRNEVVSNNSNNNNNNNNNNKNNMILAARFTLRGGSQWGGGFYGYRLKFWLFYGYRLIFSSYG